MGILSLVRYRNPTPNPSRIKGLSFSSPRCGGIEGGARRGDEISIQTDLILFASRI